MPDLGIVEALSALLPELLGGAAAETGAAAGAGGLESLVGTGTGLAGGATGLEGTALAGGATGGIGSLIGGGGADALGTAASFLSAPGASLLSPATGAVAEGGIEAGLLGPTGAAEGGANAAANAITGGGLPADAGSSIASLVGGPSTGAGTTAVGGAPNSVFNTGANPLPGVGSAGQPAAVSAGSVAAPSGVAPTPDPTAAANTASAAGGGTPGASSSIESLIGKAGGGITDSLTKNPLGIALGAGGLGYNILKGQKDTANQSALKADAATATANSQTLADKGAALQQYLTNGTLPPNYQAQVDQAINDAKTTAISNAAQQGLPTDPTKNTALAATLAKIDASRPAMQTQVASQLFQSGAGLVSAGQNAAGLSADLYKSLVANDTAAAANTGKAIASLAAALNGKSQSNLGGITISQG